MSDTRTPLDPLTAPPAPSAELSLRVRQAVQRTPAPTSTVRERILFAILGIPFAIGAGLVGSGLVFTGRPALRIDFAVQPPFGLTERLAILLVLAGVATGAALAPGEGTTDRPGSSHDGVTVPVARERAQGVREMLLSNAMGVRRT